MNGNFLKTYRNSTPVVNINGYEMKVEDVIFSAIVGGINTLIVSETGGGKTQILYDVLYGLFGGKGNYIRATPDMDIKDVFIAINLEKLTKKEGTTQDVIEIVESVKSPFTAIDELNRAPPITQNQLLNILDGYIEFRGRRYPLGFKLEGNEYYHVGMASINVGDKYYGTFGIDPAILDRFGLIVDIDYYYPRTEDIIEILYQEPSLTVPQTEDRLNEILKHYKEIKSRNLPIETILVILYLNQGIDYVSKEPYSQRKLKGNIPDGTHEKGGIQGLLSPISVRCCKQIAHLYKAMTYVAELMGYPHDEDFYLNNTLEVLKLILPYSGSLKKDMVDGKYHGNQLLATQEVIREVKKKFESMSKKIVDVIVKKRNGTLILEDLESFDEEWKFVKEFIRLTE